MLRVNDDLILFVVQAMRLVFEKSMHMFGFVEAVSELRTPAPFILDSFI